MSDANAPAPRGARRLSPLALISRPLTSFHPLSLPASSRRNYRRELTYTFLFSTALAVIEGGIIGVLVNNAFHGVVPDLQLSYIVALLMAAPEFANITSFLWTAAAHGRNKVRFLNTLQAAAIVLVALVAVVPRSPLGLYTLCALLLSARVCIAGVVTLRGILWRANYTRHHRAAATGRFSTVTVIVVSVTGFLVGLAMKWNEQSFRVIVPAVCALAALGVFSYGRIRLRGHRAMLKAERETSRAARPSINPIAVARLLREDRWYARFQACMFTLGAGNLMLAAPLVITLREQFNVGYARGILVTNSVAYLVMPWFVPLWALLLSRTHVVRFRALHSWVFVLAQAVICAAVWTNTFWLLYAGAVLQGIGYGGGTLAWNLGHLDFAPAHKATQYMGAHVTLNGVRGLLAPFVAVSIYEWLETTRRGAGVWVFAFSVALCIAGALGFMHLSRAMGEAARRAPRE